MARSIWKGTLSFGLVEIPVALVSASRSEETLSFTMLDHRDLSPVGYKRVNNVTGEEVPWEKVVKGYEHEDGRYVVLEPEDFKRAEAERADAIEIVDFVDGAQIESVFYEKPYYLAPQRRASKGYVLLRETLRRTGKVGIAKFVLRAREHLAALSVRGDALSLVVLRYAHELREPTEIDVPTAEEAQDAYTKKELELAEKLVAGMTVDWEPGSYKDTYHQDLLKVIEAKVKAGRTAEVPDLPEPAKRSKGEIRDLMPLLKESLEKRSGKTAPRAAAAKPRAARSKTRKGA